MVSIVSDEWIVDLGAMACRNINNKIVITFEKKGKALLGKIKDMPIEMIIELAGKPDGHKYMRKAVKEAEKVFCKAYHENMIESGIRK